MRTVVIGSLFIATVLSAAPAMAQQQYSGSVTSGRNQLGSTNCGTYAMKMDLTVTGSDIKATFQQAGRDQRNFAAKADASGAFTTEAVVGGGNKMKVTGKITPNEATVRLDGYCLFDFKLAKK